MDKIRQIKAGKWTLLNISTGDEDAVFRTIRAFMNRPDLNKVEQGATIGLITCTQRTRWFFKTLVDILPWSTQEKRWFTRPLGGAMVFFSGKTMRAELRKSRCKNLVAELEISLCQETMDS